MSLYRRTEREGGTKMSTDSVSESTVPPRNVAQHTGRVWPLRITGPPLGRERDNHRPGQAVRSAPAQGRSVGALGSVRGRAAAVGVRADRPPMAPEVGCYRR